MYIPSKIFILDNSRYKMKRKMNESFLYAKLMKIFSFAFSMPTIKTNKNKSNIIESFRWTQSAYNGQKVSVLSTLFP